MKPLAIACKKLKPGEILEEEYPLLWALGCAWEEYCASFYPGMDYQPGGVALNGIHGTADGISLDPKYGTVVEEFKFTFKGERSDLPHRLAADSKLKKFSDEWMWQHQGRAYCKLYNAVVVRWHVCHVRGDYKSFGPIYKRYTFEFSKKEVQQTWDMLKGNKELAVPE